MSLPGITTQTVASSRLRTQVLFCGPEDGVPVVFVHGNLSAATWWEEVMLALPEGFRGIAPDLRSYGGADPAALVDATRGMGDFSDDLAALMDALGIDRAHLVGHSLGGAVLWKFLADHPGRAITVTQVCPASPTGFGGGSITGPFMPDGAGSGGGAVNPEFARRLAEGDRSSESEFSPREILNKFVWKPPIIPARIEEILDAALAQHCGPQSYPGDHTVSQNWPGVAPGVWGPINALSPLYQADPLAWCWTDAKPQILWIRGADDAVVSDTSVFDFGFLGQVGAVPGWPGADVFPPQQMIQEISGALSNYEDHDGPVWEVVIPDCGHSPYLEKPEAFNAAFHRLLLEARY